jgi:hypothetical protein
MRPDETLKPAAAAGVTGLFKCYSKNITSLSGIEYFTGISSLEVKYNPALQTIPDISGLINLTIIGLDSNGLTSLPNLSTFVNLRILSCHDNFITSIPSLTGLTNLEVLFVHHNNITSIPDLSSQGKLAEFMCSDNPISSLPDFTNLVKLKTFICQRTSISALPSLNNCVLLQYFVCTDNNMSSLPAMNNCTQLIEIYAYNCKLTSLPDITNFPALTKILVANNYLSFEDIKPLTSNTNFSSFNLSPQYIDNLGTVLSYEKSITTIDLGIDASQTDNVYSWYKDGIFFQTTSLNKLVFSSVLFSDAGVYTCIVSNSRADLTGVVLNSKPITLTVTPCILANDVRYEILTTDCSYPIKVVVDESSFTGGVKPFTYTIKSRNDSIIYSSSSLSITNEGIYDLIVKDNAGCSIKFTEKLNIPHHENCDPVFYPNGDGIADVYFINEPGKAKVYNRHGEIVKTIITPGIWDGTNTNGNDAPTGLYVIEVNSSFSIRITLLR